MSGLKLGLASLQHSGFISLGLVAASSCSVSSAPLKISMQRCAFAVPLFSLFSVSVVLAIPAAPISCLESLFSNDLLRSLIS